MKKLIRFFILVVINIITANIVSATDQISAGSNQNQTSAEPNQNQQSKNTNQNNSFKKFFKMPDVPNSENPYLYKPEAKDNPEKPPAYNPDDDPEGFLLKRESDGTIKVIGRSDITVEPTDENDTYNVTYRGETTKIHYLLP